MKMRTEHILVLIMLLMNSVTDLKRKEIFLKGTIIFLLSGFFLTILNRIHGMGIPASLMAGGTAAGLSLLSGGRIGMGDALVILALCVYLPAEEMLGILSAASVLCMGAGVFMMIRGAGKNARIPFVPFLFLGSIVVFFMKGRSCFLWIYPRI